MFKGSTYRLARLLLLLTAAIVGTDAVGRLHRQWMLLLLAVPALIFLFSALFRLHFQNIRKMTFMFNSIENGDYSFKFTEYDAPVSDNLLNLTLNRIKDLLVKAKNEVIDKERYYELILNSVHTGVIVLNETGNVYQINNEARRLIGLPRFTHINQLATIDRSLQELFFAIRGGERKQASYSNERGTVYLAVNASEITIRGKRLRILAVNDINNELDERETESWIRLIRVLTHEIMNSITPITSLSDTLLGMENKVGGRGSRGTGSDQFDRQEPDPLRGSLSQGDPHSDSPAHVVLCKTVSRAHGETGRTVHAKGKCFRPASHYSERSAGLCRRGPDRTGGAESAEKRR